MSAGSLSNHLREKNKELLRKLRDRKDRIYQNRIRVRNELRFKPYSAEYKKTLQARFLKEKKTRKLVSIFVMLISVGISACIFWLLFY